MFDITNDIVQKEYKYDMCWIDADTILYQAAATVQTNYIIATHITSGKQKRFKNKTEFWGRSKKVIGGWLGDQNKARESKQQVLFTREDFSVEQFAEVDSERFETNEEAVKFALDTIGYKVGEIKAATQCKDYRLIIGAGYNYRNDIAIQKKYKGGRGPKPILFSAVRDAMCNQYKRTIIESFDEEAEDYVSRMMNIEYKAKLKEKRDWKECYAAVDKDVWQVPGPALNYNKCSEGVHEYTSLERLKFLCAQCLSGDDSTDAIGGLPNLPQESTDSVGMRRTRGVNRDVALEYLENFNTPKDVVLSVINAYKWYYKTPVEVEHWKTKEKLVMTWMDFLTETAQLVYLRREEGEMFDFFKFAKNFGVEEGVDY